MHYKSMQYTIGDSVLVGDSADKYAFEDTLRATRVVLVYLLIYNAL